MKKIGFTAFSDVMLPQRTDFSLGRVEVLPTGMSMKFVLCLITSFFWLTPASRAQEPIRVVGVQIVEKGIYEALDRKHVEQTGVVGNNRKDISDITFRKDTDSIPIKKNTLFGVKYKIIGQPLGEPVSLTLKTLFPGRGLRDPNSHELVPTNEYDEVLTIGDTHYRGYRLEADWELAPGVWTLEFWYENQKLAEQKFKIGKGE